MSQQHDDDGTVIRPATSGTPPTRTLAAPREAAEHDQHGEDGLSLRIGARLGEFEITRRLGDGGFSIVYLAMDHSLERTVALKEYMPSSLASRVGVTVQARSQRHRDTFDAGLKSFVNEAKLLASFDHPALVKVHRFWEAHGTAYMAMPFYQGVTVKDAVRAMPGPPDEAWLLTLLAPLTEALMVIHAESCFHRDIAPDNVILLAGSGKPLLLDFGAARRVIGDMTQGLTVILKSGYAPVEQYAEIPGMKQGPWTDVYALAAVVYWAITGSTPPPSVGRMMSDSFVPLARCAAGRYSIGFLQTIDRALVVLPEQRIQSIEALRRELGLAGAGATAAPVLPAWDDSDATVIRPAGYRAGPSTGAAPRSAAWIDPTLDPATRGRSTEPPPARTFIPEPQQPRPFTADPDERTVLPPRREDDRRSRDQPAAAVADAPPRSRLRMFIIFGLGTVVVAAGAWWVVQRLSAPAVPAVGEARVADPTPGPASGVAAPSEQLGPVVAPKPAAPAIEPAPVEAPTAAPAGASNGVVEATATPPANPQPSEPMAPLVKKVPPADSGSTQSGSNSRRAQRADAAKATPPPPAVNPNATECASIMLRFSLGETSPQLVERLKALNCR